MADSDVPTFPVQAPDGETLNVPYFPNLGERHVPQTHGKEPPAVPQRHVPETQPAHAHHSHAQHPHGQQPQTQNFWQRARDVATHGVQSAWNFVAGDDIRTLRDPKAPLGSKILSGVSLAATVVPGVGEDKLIAKAGLEVGETIVKDGAKALAEEAAKRRGVNHVLAGGWDYYKRQWHNLSNALFHDHRKLAHELHHNSIVKATVSGAKIAAPLIGGVVAGENIDRARRAHELTIQQNGHAVQLNDGFQVSGTVQSFGPVDLVILGPDGRQTSIPMSVLESTLEHPDGQTTLQDAQRRNMPVTLQFEKGRLSVHEASVRDIPIQSLRGNVSFTGQILDVSARRVVQQTSHGTFAFNTADLVLNAKDPKAFEDSLTSALHDHRPLTIAMENGKFIAHEPQLFRAQQTEHHR